MNRETLRHIHLIASRTAFLCILTFWTSTLISELFLSQDMVIWVKNAIAYGVFYGIQAVELVAGFVNLVLMSLSMKDGMSIRKPKQS